MSEEEEYFQASSSTKLLTGDSDFSVTESTSIRNPETNSSAEEVIKPEKLSSLLTDLSQSLLPDQEKDQSNHSSANESEKETKDQSEADSNPIEKENIDNSSASHHSQEYPPSNKSKKTASTDSANNLTIQKNSSAALTSSFDSNSMEFTYTTITTTTTTNNNSQNQNSEEDEIITASNSLLKKGSLPPFEIQGKVLQYLKSESLQAVQDCDYPRASKLDKAINKIVQETYRKRKGNRELRREKRVDKKVEKANYLLKREEEESQTIYNNFLKEEDDKLRIIKERHKKELEMLKEEWNKPETLLPYNKSSQKLLSLRRSQKVLALTKRYDEAERLKQHADEVQKKELKEAKEKAKSAYNQAKQTLIEQHKKELLCFSDHKQRLSTFLDLERKKAIAPYKNMASFYERQQSERSLPNGKPAPKINRASSNAGFAAKRATSMFDALPPTKPEIVAGVSKFKATPETHPLGLTSIMKTKNKKNSKRSNSVALNRRPKKK